LVLLWLTVHQYKGIDNDGQLYAFQALARINPALNSDLYLQDTSQDKYTIFSPAYAATIRLLGLNAATLLLTVSSIFCFLLAAWKLVRDLVSRNMGWLSVMALIIISGDYGGAGVFHFSDNYLTPRMPAQALILLSLILHFRRHNIPALLVATTAILVHPLMAFPGLLLLICLSTPTKIGVTAMFLGILTTLAIALSAPTAHNFPRALAVMDPSWLDVVHERSHFLFLRLWSPSDWKLNAKPFLCLAITALTLESKQVRLLCLTALLVGATGIAVALIASLVAPVAILVQGQAWRWVWITDFFAITLLAPTIFWLWRDERCGKLCAVLLIAGWVFAPVDGTACVTAALALWLARAYVTDRFAVALRWTAYILCVVLLAWAAANCWMIATSSTPGSGREPAFLTRIRNILGLGISAILVIGLYWHWSLATRSLTAITLCIIFLLASTLYVAPKSLEPMNNFSSPSQIEEFADWRTAIPAASSVFLADKYDAGSFVWFTLGRPNYMSIDQSAGVVFSRATALEIRRRSDLLRPLMDPDWKLFSIVRQSHGSSDQSRQSAFRPLTPRSLVTVCADPQLGFVIAKENVGFDPVTHTRPGAWKDWNLYDCRVVRLTRPTA
jgi:hypothetical protein